MTRQRRSPGESSDRLFAVDSVYARAEQIFGDRKAALGWLDEPRVALAGRAPRELLSTELGRRQVVELLERIEHGFVA